jgi:hypothetical protein
MSFLFYERRGSYRTRRKFVLKTIRELNCNENSRSFIVCLGMPKRTFFYIRFKLMVASVRSKIFRGQPEHFQCNYLYNISPAKSKVQGNTGYAFYVVKYVKSILCPF